MSRQFSMPAQIPPVSLLPAAADAAGRTGSYRSLKHAVKAYVVVEVNQGNAATVALNLLQATSSAGAGAKALLNNIPIWLCADTSVSDALVAQAAATGTFTTSATLKDKLVVFEIEPDQALDVANGFDYIAVQTGASNASNITAAMLYVLDTYQQAIPPSRFS